MQARIRCFVYSFVVCTIGLIVSIGWIHKNPRMNIENYRLGDVVNGHLKGSCTKIKAIYYKHYPGSIATEYLQSTCQGQDWAILSSIVNKRNTIAPKDNAVVHVRLGDVAERADIKSAWFTTKTCTTEYPVSGPTPDCWYIRSALFYKETIIPALLLKNVASVRFIGSSRHCILWARTACRSKNSDWYRNKITLLFKRTGFSVTWSWNQPADVDFIMMATAQIFVVGGGGFSSSAAHCVYRNNNTVIGMPRLSVID